MIFLKTHESAPVLAFTKCSDLVARGILILYQNGQTLIVSFICLCDIKIADIRSDRRNVCIIIVDIIEYVPVGKNQKDLEL